MYNTFFYVDVKTFFLPLFVDGNSALYLQFDKHGQQVVNFNCIPAGLFLLFVVSKIHSFPSKNNFTYTANTHKLKLNKIKIKKLLLFRTTEYSSEIYVIVSKNQTNLYTFFERNIYGIQIFQVSASAVEKLCNKREKVAWDFGIYMVNNAWFQSNDNSSVASSMLVSLFSSTVQRNGEYAL